MASTNAGTFMRNTTIYPSFGAAQARKGNAARKFRDDLYGSRKAER